MDASDFSVSGTTATVTSVSGSDGDEGGGAGAFGGPVAALGAAGAFAPGFSPANHPPPEGVTIEPNMIMFTSDDWDVEQSVQVTVPEDDDAADERFVIRHVASSTDLAFDNRSWELEITVADADGPASLMPESDSISVMEGESQAWDISISHRPTETVTLELSSSDANAATVSPSVVTFEPDDWQTARAVTVSGIDDGLYNGGAARAVMVSLAVAPGGAREYAGLAANLMVMVGDISTGAGDLQVSATDLALSEGGAADSFDVSLSMRPSAEVTVTVTSSDPAVTVEGSSSISLSFTQDNWDTAQRVTVASAEDDDFENEAATLSVTAMGGGYDSAPELTVSVRVTDDDVAGARATPSDLTVAEAGGSANYEVVLDAAPTGAVTVTVLSGDTSAATVSPGTLTFTAANWSAAQTVTVTGVDDDVDNAGDMRMVGVMHRFSGGGYEGAALSGGDVMVTVTDDDAAGVSVTPTALTVSEAGGSATYEVVLESQPTGSVTVTVSSSDASAATASPGTLTFTPANWSSAQTVTVTGVDDNIDNDSDMRETSVTHALSGGGYDGVAADDVMVTITDDDDFFADEVEAVHRTLLPDILRGLADGATSAVAARFEMRRDATSTDAADAPNSLSLQGGGLDAEQLALNALTSYGQSLNDPTHDFDLLRALARQMNGRTFLLPLSADEDSDAGSGSGGGSASGGSGGGAIWGRATYRDMARGGIGSSWDGELLGVYLGADYTFGNNTTLGLMAAQSMAEADYSIDGDEGSYELSATGVHPYLNFGSPQGFNLWLTGGIGWGETTVASPRGSQTDDLSYTTIGGGLDQPLASWGSFTWRLKGDATFSMAEVEAPDGLGDPMEFEASRMRLGLEAAWNCGPVRPWFELAARSDGGDDASETGFEVGGGLRVDAPLGWQFTLEAGGLVSDNSDRDTVDRWVATAGLVRLPNSPDGTGLTLRLAPSWGTPGYSRSGRAISGGINNLLETDGVARLQGATPAASGALEQRWALELGYGLKTPRRGLPIELYGNFTSPSSAGRLQNADARGLSAAIGQANIGTRLSFTENLRLQLDMQWSPEDDALGSWRAYPQQTLLGCGPAGTLSAPQGGLASPLCGAFAHEPTPVSLGTLGAPLRGTGITLSIRYSHE